MTILIFCILGFVFSSFVEYWVHRFMHRDSKFGKKHRKHHVKNEGQGVVWEFLDYVKSTLIFMLAPFLVSWTYGVGWLIGTLGYAAFASYAHQIQHDNPQLCFWMKMPVHFVHHEYNQWESNFGLGVDWWDHIFKTYEYIDHQSTRNLQSTSIDRESKMLSFADFSKIRWL